MPVPAILGTLVSNLRRLTRRIGRNADGCRHGWHHTSPGWRDLSVFVRPLIDCEAVLMSFPSLGTVQLVSFPLERWQQLSPFYPEVWMLLLMADHLLSAVDLPEVPV